MHEIFHSHASSLRGVAMERLNQPCKDMEGTCMYMGCLEMTDKKRTLGVGLGSLLMVLKVLTFGSLRR